MPPPSEATTSALAAQSLPPLTPIDVSRASEVQPPVKRIQTEEDLAAWKGSEAHRQVSLFVARLGEAAVGKETQWPAKRGEQALSGVQAVIALLETLDTWTHEIEPKKTPQRFGNTAFRDWGARLEERSEDLHRSLLSSHPHLHAFVPELTAYLSDSFGSFVRIDYGSGHEVNFLAWLAYLSRLGFFHQSSAASSSTSSSNEPVAPTPVEEQLALRVFPLYLQVVWGLQDRYALEPAGSHGVWGLDDYQFVPYIIGAAQLRLELAYKPSSFSQPSHKPPRRLKAAELLTFLPTSSSRDLSSPPPYPNLFTSSIARIHSLKTGPFFEHSPLLSDIASSVPNWKKVHGGMVKMWDNEVMGKRPVVQHFVFGAVGYTWEGNARATGPEGAKTTKPVAGGVPAMTATMAPTAAPSRSMPPPIMAPWARGGATGMPAASPAPSSSLGPRVAAERVTGEAARTPTGMPPVTKAPWAK
ncbi:Phosphotyrosyl phosphatase activator [Jaminaea rosea]|uniref:Serine/threonine-protein phosphatase 2A activator n=1 Tax=Jaminaea rosea TaxID=1569628 RepID=A0A316UNT5_9BASI|nr:Phosphotyrosyl phosphatase activator [Jaminaea rosea]PWN25573.1 Phosphotyrosyl phosphatase activator [Jaminaea rosea]